MTTDRANAYSRVVSTLHDLGPAKLWPWEQACIREAADTLVFSSDVHDDEARRAFAAVAELSDMLVDAGRWTHSRARRLVDDIWACCPEVAIPERIAA
jgi:hypothetical protein